MTRFGHGNDHTNVCGSLLVHALPSALATCSYREHRSHVASVLPTDIEQRIGNLAE